MIVFLFSFEHVFFLVATLILGEKLTVLCRADSKDSLPGSQPVMRGRQMNSSYTKVSAVGDEENSFLNDSVFGQNSSFTLAEADQNVRIRSASSGVGSRNGSLSVHHGGLNSSFTKSAFSNENVARLLLGYAFTLQFTQYLSQLLF